MSKVKDSLVMADKEKVQAQIEQYLQKDKRVIDFELEEEDSSVKGCNYFLQFRNIDQLYSFYFDFSHSFDFTPYMIRDQIADLLEEGEELVVDCYIDI